MSSHVTAYPAASPEEAARYFERRLGYETDCWDVHDSSTNGTKDYVLLDVRGPGAFRDGHVPGAVHIPHREIGAERLARYPAATMFVVYCAGPHCNGANKAALKLARLGRPVKEMIGGITGWLDEGFSLDASPEPASVSRGR